MPLDTPPGRDSASAKAGSLFCNIQSRRLNPVDIHRVGEVLKSCNACAAETVGIRSEVVSHANITVRTYLRAMGDEKLECPGPWIEL